MKIRKIILLNLIMLLIFSGCSEERISNHVFEESKKDETTFFFQSDPDSMKINLTEKETENEEWIRLNSMIKMKKMEYISLSNKRIYKYENDRYNLDHLIGHFVDLPIVNESNLDGETTYELTSSNGSNGFLSNYNVLFYNEKGVMTSYVGSVLRKDDVLPEGPLSISKELAIEKSKEILKELGVVCEIQEDHCYTVTKENYEKFLETARAELKIGDEKDEARRLLYSNATPFDFYEIEFLTYIDSLPIASDDLIYSWGVTTRIMGTTIECEYSEDGIESFYVSLTVHPIEEVEQVIEIDTTGKAIDLFVSKFDQLILAESISIMDLSVIYCPLSNGELVPCWVFHLIYEESQMEDYIIFNSVNGDEIN